MRYLFTLLLALLTLPAFAQQSKWYMLAHDDGCVDLKNLLGYKKLSRIPTSPDEFAQMMRERGEKVSIGGRYGFPSGSTGGAVQVNVGDSASILFVQEEVCRVFGKQ